MEQLHAVILHRHLLFRDLIEFELRDLGPISIAGTTHDPERALEMVLEHHCGALVIESAEQFVDRHEMLSLFARAAEVIPGFVLVAANLTTSEIEVIQDTVSSSAHMGALRPLLDGVEA
jgi:DNA-binding NarL/FixJ family response regulator